MRKIKTILLPLLRQAWKFTRAAIASERVRRYRAVAFQTYVWIALLGFTVLAFFARLSDYFPFDLEATREVQSELPGWFLPLMRAVSWPGFVVQSITIMVLVGLLLALAGLRWEALASLFAGAVAGGVNTLVKIFIGRPRPDESLVDVFEKLNSYSFPSGHVMFYVAYYGFLLFLSYTLMKNSIQRWALIFFLLGLIAAVGLSRVYLGDHWASDVVGGYLLGSLTLIAAINFYRFGKRRWMPDQPVAPADRSSPETNIRKDVQ